MNRQTSDSTPAPADSKASVIALMDQKSRIETQIEHHMSVLRLNESTMDSPLLDSEGFPRADIDIVSVRNARVRVIELRNDLGSVMEEIYQGLQQVLPPSDTSAGGSASDAAEAAEDGNQDKPFARIDLISPRSPAITGGLMQEDLVISIDSIDAAVIGKGPLTPISTLISGKENKNVQFKVKRRAKESSTYTYHTVTITPNRNWGGRGLLGCHLEPYSGAQ